MLLNCKSMLQTRPRLACSSRSLFRQPTVWETEWESCSSMSSTATTIYLARSSTQSSSGTTQSLAPPHGSRLSKSSQMTHSVRRRKWKTYASSTSLSRRRSSKTRSARFVLAIFARTWVSILTSSSTEGMTNSGKTDASKSSFNEARLGSLKSSSRTSIITISQLFQ